MLLHSSMMKINNHNHCHCCLLQHTVHVSSKLVKVDVIPTVSAMFVASPQNQSLLSHLHKSAFLNDKVSDCGRHLLAMEGFSREQLFVGASMLQGSSRENDGVEKKECIACDVHLLNMQHSVCLLSLLWCKFHHRKPSVKATMSSHFWFVKLRMQH